MLFESGAVEPTGLIAGNDNDRDGTQVEPHYTQITTADQVQIYESVMSDSTGRPTTGLLNGVRFLKDNRLLPRGFDKATAGPDIAVVGDAAADADFAGGRDRVRYVVNVGAAEGPYQVDAELRFQPIGYRWAQNLTQYRRFRGEALCALLRLACARFVGGAVAVDCAGFFFEPLIESRLRRSASIRFTTFGGSSHLLRDDFAALDLRVDDLAQPFLVVVAVVGEIESALKGAR